METVGEVHAGVAPVHRLGDQGGILDRDAWKAGQGAECGDDLLRRKVGDAAQHPLNLQQDRSCYEDRLVADQGAEFLRPRWVTPRSGCGR